MASPLKILIIRLSALGDILHALPAFNDLRAAFPNARIDWLVGKKSGFLLSTAGGIDAIHTIDTRDLLHFPPNRAAWQKAVGLIRTLRAQRYDLLLDFQGLLKTAFLGYLSGARTRIGFSGELVREPPAQWFYNRKLGRPSEACHVLKLNRMLAELAGAACSGFPPLNLVAPEEDERRVASLIRTKRLENFVVLNPGGGWPTKRWSPVRYGALAARIQSEMKLPVIVTTGPGEEACFDEISGNCGSPVPHHFQVSFIQLIPLLKRALLFVGGDTGPFHLACAMETPVVGIFGPTSPVRNGPWRKRDDAVTLMLPCSPCHKRACHAKEDCMDITVDEVFSAVRRRLNRLEVRRCEL